MYLSTSVEIGDDAETEEDYPAEEDMDYECAEEAQEQAEEIEEGAGSCVDDVETAMRQVQEAIAEDQSEGS